MSEIIKYANEEIISLENSIKKIDKLLLNAPEGWLKWQNVGSKTYYYHEYVTSKDKKTNTSSNSDSRVKTKRVYIKKKSSLASTLANKQYYKTLKPVLIKNLNELKRFITRYQNNLADKIFDSLSEERKKLITPLQMSVNEQIRKWNEEVYEKNNMYPENLRFETEQGEFVRSKSEVIIANLLYKHRKDILYKYERPLEIVEEEKVKTVYPDFTIINLNTGRIVYWEHAGRMDDNRYATDFVKKINGYIANGLLIGKDVIYTYETKEIPLDIGIVKRLLEQLI